jgi:hypothetical protein
MGLEQPLQLSIWPSQYRWSSCVIETKSNRAFLFSKPDKQERPGTLSEVGLDVELVTDASDTSKGHAKQHHA